MAKIRDSPADASMPLLFSLTQPMSKLTEMLLDDLAGQALSLTEIYECEYLFWVTLLHP